jgi:hypothetical protein
MRLAVLLAVLTGCQAPAIQQVAVQSFHVAFSGQPDGEVPLLFPAGAATVTANPDSDPGTHFRIEHGTLTNRPGINGRTASYLSTPDLDGPVTRIGARWTFKPGSGSAGIMALLISKNLMTPPVSMHLAITPDSWSFGVWPPGEGADRLIELRTGSFGIPLPEDGVQINETEVNVDGNRAEIRLPDENVITITDDRIAEWSGPYAVFEAFANNGATASRAAFTDIWASSGA